MGINLLDLHNELLLYLGELSPIGVLNSLILTNRRLAELLNPVLWQFEGPGAENMNLNPPDLSTEFQPRIQSAEELLPYAISTNNPLMIKKVLQQSPLDYQCDPNMIIYTFQTAVDAGQYECVQMLLAAMEEQHETFDVATMRAVIQIAMDQCNLPIMERLLQHSKISKKSWINIGKQALKMHNEQLLRIILDCSSQSDPAPQQADLNHILHFTAIIGYVPSVALLSERGADVNMMGLDVTHPWDTPVDTAARRNHLNAVDWMIDHGGYINTKLPKEQTVAAAAIGKLPALDLFASHRRDICGKVCDDSLYPPSSQGLPTGFGVEARNFDRWILSLAFSNCPTTISQLLDQLDLARIGEEILFRTLSWRGNPLLLKELLARGVSFAARRENNNILHCIASNTFDQCNDDQIQHNIDAAEFVIDVRPKTLSEAGKNGNTPLHLAFDSQMPFMITALLKRGACPHIPNNHGITPIGLMPDYWGDRSEQMFAAYL
ncbi:ankyrin repeat-containing domain protein [Aspergillus pseudotamarii]|uniref:Ankyrin repeat-containing domain protein n=1 Tax=Aspergillus pseudotamarii TaxID=132259 RepID=A0A5N6SK69_ASPPS|nr:ankyrin repeat-containing domain protein [Aspergillus pseudotamarii]KAE8133793.1 ankyrin repeat-containing domain protein [Aspergillus pseudotamarii]